MPYEKQDFKDGNVLEASQLNHMEEGIYDAAQPEVGSKDEYGKKTAQAIGKFSFAQGDRRDRSGAPDEPLESDWRYNQAIGTGSMAVGMGAVAYSRASKSMGYRTQAGGPAKQEHLDERPEAYCKKDANGDPVFQAENVGQAAAAFGSDTVALANNSFAEGYKSKALMPMSHAEGNATQVLGTIGHAEGSGSIAYSRASHAEGEGTKAGHIDHPNDDTAGVAKANWLTGAHAEGVDTEASARAAHAEGDGTKASGKGSHTEGYKTEASGTYAHAEGNETKAKAATSHTEGKWTETNGLFSHAQGVRTTVQSGEAAHVEGIGTVANGTAQHVQGRWNEIDTAGKYAHIVGNGSGNYNTNTATKRANIHTLDWSGNAWFKAKISSGSIETGSITAKGGIISQGSISTSDWITAGSDDIATWGSGIVTCDRLTLRSANGRQWWITVSDEGQLEVNPAWE